jgi:vancomycin resistance protein YoaR
LAPAASVRPPVVTRPKAVTKPKTTPPPQTAKPRATRKAPATRTRAKSRESKQALAPKPRTLTRAQRVVTWARYPAAVYYVVYIQRGSKTVFQTRTARTRALLPARLAVKPGTYHLVVRPAIPNDAGITLGPATIRMKLKL